MAVYEFQGKNAEEAIKTACRTLNIQKELMEIEVIEPGSAGIFGLVGSKKAKIKILVPDKKTTSAEDAEPSARPEPETKFTSEGSEAISPEMLVKGTTIAKEALENILALIPIEDILINAKQEDGVISLEIEGDKSGLLIGRKGRTLDALQYIVNKIVNRALERRAQVTIDSESYRQRRKEFLTQMALEMGTKAKKTKKPVATNLLYPQDRRIVHLALRDDDKLTTKSRGDGLFKKVIIIPNGS